MRSTERWAGVIGELIFFPSLRLGETEGSDNQLLTGILIRR
jgi:hypothetical protein